MWMEKLGVLSQYLSKRSEKNLSKITWCLSSDSKCPPSRCKSEELLIELMLSVNILYKYDKDTTNKQVAYIVVLWVMAL